MSIITQVAIDMVCLSGDPDAVDPLCQGGDCAHDLNEGLGDVGAAHVHEQYQSRLLPTSTGLTLAKPIPPESGSGQDSTRDASTGKSAFRAEVAQPSSRQSPTIHELLWPGARAHRGLLPGEHKVRAPATIAKQADPDDGQLQIEEVLDTASLEHYLAVAGEAQDDTPLATAAGADPNGVQGDGVHFVDSDNEDILPEANNVDGHLPGLLEAPGANMQDERADQVDKIYRNSTAEAYFTTTQVPQARVDTQQLQRVLDMLRARRGQFENGARASVVYCCFIVLMCMHMSGLKLDVRDLKPDPPDCIVARMGYVRGNCDGSIVYHAYARYLRVSGSQGTISRCEGAPCVVVPFRPF
jgi:hypothetical protein